MDSEKLNALCDEARLQGFDLSEIFVVDSDSDKEKVQKLKTIVRCINNLEKTKKQIENEISITKKDTTKELKFVRDCNLNMADCIGESLRRAILGKSNSETIKHINDAIYGFGRMVGYRNELEALRERLNFEEVEHDNQ